MGALFTSKRVLIWVSFCVSFIPKPHDFISDLSLGALPVTRPSDAGSPTDRNGTDVTVVQTPLGVL